MDEDRNQEPGERMRNIFSSSDDEANAQFKPKSEPKPQPQSQSRSPLEQLPRLKPASQASPQAAPKEIPPQPDKAPPFVLPEKKVRDEKTVVKSVDVPEMSRGEKLRRALWTIASVISMTVNVIVIIVLVIAFWAYRDIKLPEGVDVTMVNKLLGGLYSNFEKLDRATIKTVIPVDAQIPLDITVPVQTTTQITLAETVNIPNAQVVINTGGLNINSTARVTLPAGTPLTVNLDFDLPVQNTIPVHLEVPVNIPMADTELHEPFVGLQEVVEPLYCIVDPKASNLDGQFICR